MSRHSQSQHDYNQLVDLYYAKLYRFAFSLTNSQADASDLTQQTFCIWLEKGHQLRDPEKVKTWLFTTLYREFLHVKRKLSVMTSDEGIAEDVAEELECHDNQCIDPNKALAAIASLTEFYRTPLILLYMREHSYQEIADIIGVPIGTVKSRVSRGKAMLYKIIESDLTDFDDSLEQVGAE
ncbi:RNA polymerase sigma factor [Photobacterium sp. DNB23_23_1]|uniref:RNA polymerase sigma factor n=1 Tax=Photobacterium pectinilyticum TaxID=2906793 RepID=A0ABT1N341_9GAMM|nr:RNA polymerase sigma factor [Photobacterium sp. ZSDE20]MCQ1059166.1 RNA polymerase sigma factor [Photobacterium sp. ZSDE20]MDD1824818.1 RNA polymerase sigma factor [Photobacterium sp. ZSDE20]